MKVKDYKQELVARIMTLKERKKAAILAHNYQIPGIQDIADVLGDSLGLAKISKTLSSSHIVFCGVKFMAETVKILSPHKRVFLPVVDAGCPLADMIQAEELIELKRNHPEAWVVTYVNTSAEVKSLSDVCCTSANAINVVKNIPVKKVIFIPDKNLGWWVAKNVPHKELVIWNGFCYVHEQFTLNDLRQAKKVYPDAEALVHPECRREILEEVDYVLSTSGMLKRAKASSAQRFIIGTEEGLLYRLKNENPQKEFYSLGNARMCINMKKTGLDELYSCLEKEAYEVELQEQIIEKARVALERMVEYV
ncbi:MAG: quinolinate synthase NadA [Candidatus Omnitrophota bacterium]|nr:MAG: quinolinate synthase NadA [Candidatus Omnitrophota bacterium]